MLPASVLIVDDSPLVRESLGSLLEREDDLAVVGEAEDGQAALVQAVALSPSIVLMDLQMPVMDGITATRLITEQLPAIKVMALTTFSTTEYVIPALRAGASGYLVKDAGAGDLLNAIRRVLADEMILSASVGRALAENVIQANPDRGAGQQTVDPGPLTEREVQTIHWLAQGLTNRDIGRQMYVSESSVKTYLATICRKLGVANRVQLLIRAYQKGWVEPPTPR